MTAPIQAPEFAYNTTEPDAVHVLIDVNVPKAAYDQLHAKAFREIAQQAEIRGFRKGKAPTAMVERAYGELIREKTLEKIVEKAGAEGISPELSERLVASPQMARPPSHDAEGGLSFALGLELRPQIPPLNWEGLEVFAPSAEPTEDMVDQAIEAKRKEKSSLQTVSGRTRLEVGDYAVCDYQGTLEGEDKPHGLLSSEGQTIQVTDSDEPLPGRVGFLGLLARRLAGAEVEVPMEFSVELPKEYALPAMIGKTAQVKLTVREIRASVLPTLDDEFARDLDFEDLAAMRASIRADLAKKVAEQAENALNEELIQGLLARHSIQVPPTLVRRQSFMDADRALGGQYRKQDEQFLRTIAQALAPMAEKRVRAGLLLNALLEQLKIEATDELLEAAYAKQAAEEGEPLPKIKARYSKNAEELEDLKDSVANDELFRRLSASAKIERISFEEYEKRVEARNAPQAAASAPATDADAAEAPASGDDAEKPAA